MIAARLGIFALGAVSSLGFAPWSLWPATIGGLILLLRIAGMAPSWRRAAAVGWWYGWGLGCASLTWLAHAFTYQAAMPAWLGWPAVVILAAYTACYWALPLGLAHLFTARGGATPYALCVAALFVIAEWLRGIFLTGFPWNPLGAIWLPVSEIARGAATIGALGLSGITMLAAGLIASATRDAGWRPLALAAIVMGVPMAVAGPRAARDTGTAISLVQGNIDQADKWRPGQGAAQLERYIALSGSPGAAIGPRLTFWPEAAIIDPLDSDPALRRRATAILRPGDLLFTGATGTAGPDGYSNSVFVLDAAGRILGRYDKSHLVPFGEYLPFAEILGRLGASRLVPGEAAFVPGPGPHTLTIGGLRAGVSICYEIIFPSAIIEQQRRPAFLFNPSNDAWFGAGGPEQHLAQARLRAIEEGLPIIRATPTGHTAVIRSDGSIAASLPAHEAARLNTVLPAIGPATLAGRWGTSLSLAVAIGLFAAVSLTGFARRRSPSTMLARRRRFKFPLS